MAMHEGWQKPPTDLMQALHYFPRGRSTSLCGLHKRAPGEVIDADGDLLCDECERLFAWTRPNATHGRYRADPSSGLIVPQGA
ncbi:MAG: hypothetical protein WC683_04870 [bacterium]